MRCFSAEQINPNRNLLLAVASLAALLVFAMPIAKAEASLKTISTQSGLPYSLGDWKIARNSTPSAARTALGVEDAAAPHAGNSCVRQWIFRGMRIEFQESRPGKKACAVGNGFATSFSVFGEAGRANWQTGLRLRVGDSVARLRILYPQAVFTAGRWVLADFPKLPPWGRLRGAKLTTGASVVARVSAGRVSSLVYSVVAADALEVGVMPHITN